MIKITRSSGTRSLPLSVKHQKMLCRVPIIPMMKSTVIIRRLVEKALHIKQLTPDIENEINYELTRLGHISDVDFEALELLMSEMDAGRIQLVSSR